MASNRRMCNELVHELCLQIPTAKTSDLILLTARKIYAYLEPHFSKKLIYRDAIAFLKANLNAEKMIRIQIDQVVHNNDSEPIVIHQKQSEDEFELETNKFSVRFQNKNKNEFKNIIIIPDNDGQLEWAHLLYFLRLIAPLLHPIQFSLWITDIPTAGHVRFLDTQSDWIGSIRLWGAHLKSQPIYGALSKYNKLEICGPLSPVIVPKLVQWLTENNNSNGRPKKKCLFHRNHTIYDGLVLLIKELKKEFARATSKSRFVVCLVLRQPLNRFTLCNERTEEKLELCRKNTENGRFIHALSRFPCNRLDDNENDFAELDSGVVTQICLG